MIMVQDKANTKSKIRCGKWWEIQFVDSSGSAKTEIIELAWLAEFRLKELANQGIAAKIRRCRFDIVIVASESMIVINRRMRRAEACRWARDWTKVNASTAGVLIWPSDLSLPTTFTIVYESATESSAIESQSNLVTIAQESIESSQLAVEKLIDSIPLSDQFALGVLGPILAGLRDAEEGLERLDN